jgi:hypothetical protein
MTLTDILADVDGGLILSKLPAVCDRFEVIVADRAAAELAAAEAAAAAAEAAAAAAAQP